MGLGLTQWRGEEPHRPARGPATGSLAGDSSLLGDRPGLEAVEFGPGGGEVGGRGVGGGLGEADGGVRLVGGGLRRGDRVRGRLHRRLQRGHLFLRLGRGGLVVGDCLRQGRVPVGGGLQCRGGVGGRLLRGGEVGRLLLGGGGGGLGGGRQVGVLRRLPGRLLYLLRRLGVGSGGHLQRGRLVPGGGVRGGLLVEFGLRRGDLRGGGVGRARVVGHRLLGGGEVGGHLGRVRLDRSKAAGRLLRPGLGGGQRVGGLLHLRL